MIKYSTARIPEFTTTSNRQPIKTGEVIAIVDEPVEPVKKTGALSDISVWLLIGLVAFVLLKK